MDQIRSEKALALLERTEAETALKEAAVRIEKLAGNMREHAAMLMTNASEADMYGIQRTAQDVATHVGRLREAKKQFAAADAKCKEFGI